MRSILNPKFDQKLLVGYVRAETRGIARTSRAYRGHHDWHPWTLVQNRHDGRFGVTLPDKNGDLLDSDARVTLVTWWDGPIEIDVVPNWYLIDVLDDVLYPAGDS